MRRLLWISAATVAATCTAAAGQSVERDAQGVLTLKSALSEALEHNPDLHAARVAYDAARAAPVRERFLMPPALEAQIWAWPITTLNPARTDMYMFTAEQALPGRGKRAARTLVAERDAELANQAIDVRAVAILAEIRSTYVDLVTARGTRGVYDEQRQVLEDMADAATVRYASGEGVQHHTVTALVDLTRLARDRIGADERVETAEARLSRLLGRAPGTPVEALAPFVATISAEEAERRALTNHPDLAAADAVIMREEAELSRLRGEERPDYVIGGGYMLMPGGAGAWTARAGVTWPNAPWTKGRLSAQVAAQAKRVGAAKAQREAVAARIRHDVRQVSIRIAAAQRQAQLLESTVLPQAEHAFELARIAYAGGEGPFMDALESRRLLATTQLELLEARGIVSRALADLENLAGLP
jgi:cobalt-zinc-cadmium efflux system outer membrane protein